MSRIAELCFNSQLQPGQVPSQQPPWTTADHAANFLASIGLGPIETPLLNLKNMAASLGIGSLRLKDESAFPCLNSFKGRGAIWACARVCAQKLNLACADLDYAQLKRAIQGRSWQFVTATDGNHGTAVAYAGRILNQKATIFMPASSSPWRIRKILDLGAECIVTPFSYDDTVRHAARYAQSNGCILIQDTAWPGYEEIPGLIMQGYATITREIIPQLNGVFPTHIFLQVGVGSFAASIICSFLHVCQCNHLQPPVFICLEPRNAACLYKSFISSDGHSHAADGNLNTIMAGLACGELSSLAWPILRDNVTASASCADSLASLGMALLARPVGDDPAASSGESGAPGMGLLYHIMKYEQEWQKKLGLDKDSRVLLISTEKSMESSC